MLPYEQDMLDHIQRLSASGQRPPAQRPFYGRPSFPPGPRPMPAYRPPTYRPRPYYPSASFHTRPHRPGANKSLVLNQSSSSYTPPARPSVASFSYRAPALRPFPAQAHFYPPRPHSRPRPPSNVWNPSGHSQHKKLIIRRQATSGPLIETKQNSAGQTIVTIDGVPYVSKGKKLIRQDNAMSTDLAKAPPRVLVRRLVRRRDGNKNMVLGKVPETGKRKRVMKTKGNSFSKNMVLRRQPEGYERHGKHALVLTGSKKQQAHRFCRSFTRHGTCANPKCSFVHELAHRAICPRFLFAQCPKEAVACRLAHLHSPHIQPHCIHFQNNACNRDPCPFAHVRVRQDAPLCRSFALNGYCAKGLACKDRHVLVCPTLAVLGKCTKPNCRWPHVDANSNSKDNTKPAPKRPKTTHWVRPELVQERKEQRRRMQLASTTTKPGEGDDTEESGFVPLFGGDDDDDDAWNQYLIKDSNDLPTITNLRFDDHQDSDEDQGSDEDQDSEEDQGSEEEEDNGEEEYEDVSDSDVTDADVEEIFEAVSDDEEDA